MTAESAFQAINEDDHAWVFHCMPPWALRQDMTQLGHDHVPTVALDQLRGVVLPYPIALVAFDPHQREREFAQAPGSVRHLGRYPLVFV